MAEKIIAIDENTRLGQNDKCAGYWNGTFRSMDKNNYGLIEISFQFRVFKEKNFFDKMFFRTPTKVMLCTMPVLKLLQINKNGTCTIGTPEIYTNPYHDANPAYGSHAEQLLGKDLFSNSITIPVRDILSVGFIERGIRGN